MNCESFFLIFGQMVELSIKVKVDKCMYFGELLEFIIIDFGHDLCDVMKLHVFV